MRKPASFVATALCLVSIAGCDSKPQQAPAPAATALPPSSAPVTAKTRSFVIDPTGTSRIDMPGKSEHIKAHTSAARGTLSVEPTALQNSRGEVQIDLSTLSTETFDDPGKNAEQTKHARTWLEVVVDGTVKEENRYATLAIRSVDVIGETDLTKVPVNAGVRQAKAVVHGDVLVHGHKVERSVPVILDFSYADGAPGDAPTALHIRTEKPLALVLKEHEIMPRDPVGKLLKWTQELTSRVNTDANVDVDLNASLRADAAAK